ncbi:MAG TPA: hypothetical protein H9881_16675 [Candidatus Stackebrandtia excrementipullorum]|nr:hypothetical protein [Candidatus Stackebrandtia excrementipullorum]
MPPVIPLPTFGAGGSAATVVQDVERWVSSDPIRDLAARFGGTVDISSPLKTKLDGLLELSSRRWDFRAGRERAEAIQPVFDSETAELVVRAAVDLGLARDTWPRFDQYDHVVVLGGLFRTCLARTRYAARLLERGVVAAAVTALGGFRPLTAAETETQVQGTASSGFDFEIDALVAGLAEAFTVDEIESVKTGGDPAVDPNRAWSVTTLKSGDDIALKAVAAPSSQPEVRRADTADTIRFWVEQVASLRSSDRVLVVTSPIYVPFQHCDAIRTIGIPFGAGVDTVGLRADWLPRSSVPHSSAPARYLQEIRSTLLSMSRLVTAIEAAEA